MGVKVFAQQHELHSHFVWNTRDGTGNQTAGESQLGLDTSSAYYLRPQPNRTFVRSRRNR